MDSLLVVTALWKRGFVLCGWVGGMMVMALLVFAMAFSADLYGAEG